VGRALVKANETDTVALQVSAPVAIAPLDDRSIDLHLLSVPYVTAPFARIARRIHNSEARGEGDVAIRSSTHDSESAKLLVGRS
jgi:hypothetical protein